MRPANAIPFAKSLLELDQTAPSNYNQRRLNLHGLGVFLGGNQGLSMPKAQWPDRIKKVRDDFLNGAE